MRGDACMGGVAAGMEAAARTLLYPLALSTLLVMLLPIAAAFSSRCPGARLVSAWRGVLRRILPVAIALAALAYLGIHIAAADTEHPCVQRDGTRCTGIGGEMD
jgi:hypothetical protein